MAATVAEAWQQVQQKILPPPLPPSPTPLTHSGLNTKVAAKQQNPFNPIDENKKQHDGTEKNSLIRAITLLKDNLNFNRSIKVHKNHLSLGMPTTKP